MSNKRLNTSLNKWQNKEWLEKQYYENKLSFKKIGLLCGKSDCNIRYFFKKYNLLPRPSPFKNKGIYHGENNPRWKGGRVLDSHGYTRIFFPGQHDYKGKNQKYVLEHVLIMEKYLGRKLKHPEIIHHKNGIVSDNHIQNLQLFSNPFDHNTFEQHLGLFCKRLLYGDLCPEMKDKIQSIFNNFLASIVNER